MVFQIYIKSRKFKKINMNLMFLFIKCTLYLIMLYFVTCIHKVRFVTIFVTMSNSEKEVEVVEI